MDSALISASSSEELSSPPAKRSRQSKKVCILCWSDIGGVDNYTVLIVDLDSFNGHYDTRFRLKHRIITCFASLCVLGSTLYIFEGFDLMESREGKTSVLCVDLESTNGEFNLESCAVALKNPKATALSVPTPDGKRIIVFSRLLDFGLELCSQVTDFEIYTPGVSSEPLPNISIICKDSAWVSRFGFIDESRFLVQISECFQTGKFYYMLDLKMLGQGWERCDSYPKMARIPGNGFFFMAEERFYFDAYATYDMSGQKYVSHSHGLPPFADVGFTIFTPLGYDTKSRECRFCVLRSPHIRDPHEWGDKPFDIRIDVCCTDIKQYIADGGGEKGSAKLIKTLCFSLDLKDQRYCGFVPVSIYPF